MMEQPMQQEVTVVLEKHHAQRTRCEVYSRIVGYLRPVSQWNVGKKQEFINRKTYDQTEGLV